MKNLFWWQGPFKYHTLLPLCSTPCYPCISHLVTKVYLISLPWHIYVITLSDLNLLFWHISPQVKSVCSNPHHYVFLEYLTLFLWHISPCYLGISAPVNLAYHTLAYPSFLPRDMSPFYLWISHLVSLGVPRQCKIPLNCQGQDCIHTSWNNAVNITSWPSFGISTLTHSIQK